VFGFQNRKATGFIQPTINQTGNTRKSSRTECLADMTTHFPDWLQQLSTPHMQHGCTRLILGSTACHGAFCDIGGPLEAFPMPDSICHYQVPFR
jgi:hypothetical protein